MQYENLTIITPIDDPCAYDPDWRHKIAQFIIIAHRPSPKSIDAIYRPYLTDKWILKYCKTLRRMSTNKPLNEEQCCIRMARQWFENPSPAGVRFRLEPLLLTGATMETILLDISGGTVPKEAFTFYEKLFFNIRDEEGRLSKSCQLRQSFALPNGDDMAEASPQEVWKAIACLMGYDVLMHVWMWQDAHGLSTKGAEFLLDETWRAAQSRLFFSVFTDRVGHKSLADILSTYTNQFKTLKDYNQASTGGNDTTKALMAVLYQTSPKMVSMAKDVDALQAQTAEIQARISSQLAIEKQKIEDKGKSASDSVVEAQILEAVRS